MSKRSIVYPDHPASKDTLSYSVHGGRARSRDMGPRFSRRWHIMLHDIVYQFHVDDSFENCVNVGLRRYLGVTVLQGPGIDCNAL